MVEAEKNGPRAHGPVASERSELTPDYLAALVHELRNPLTPIRTAAELLRSLCSDPRQLHAVELISRQVVTLTHTLEDAVEAAKRRRGLLTLSRRTIDAGQLLEEALAPVRSAIDARRQNLLVSLPNEAVQMDCDPVRLGQVVQILLSNATRYTPEGGSIAARVQRERDELVIEVSDDGVGMSPDALAHVFNVFTRSGENGGFSLALARNIVELHGGSIRAESQGVGRGSRFTIRLPLHVPPEQAAPQASAAAGNPLNIVIIDDHPDSVRGWVEHMLRAGHSVLTAESGELGVALATQVRPHAIVVDIGLPGVDGFEVARQLRAQPETRQALLIAVSGFSMKQFRDIDAYSVFRHYLLKPVTPTALLYIIEQTLRHQAAAT